MPCPEAIAAAVLPLETEVVVALLVCLIPTTIGGLLSAIGIAGMDRMIQANVIAMSGRAVEAAGDVDVLLLDKTGTITLGNRQAVEFIPAEGVPIEGLTIGAGVPSIEVANEYIETLGLKRIAFKPGSVEAIQQTINIADVDLPDLPPVKPSAIAIGTVFNHAISLGVMAPVFGESYRRAQAANTKEEFLRSKEAASAAAAWGSSLGGSALQAYGVGALLNATGTMSQKGAAYLGTLIFFASSAPSVSEDSTP